MAPDLIAMALFYIIAGIAHFLKPGMYKRIVPPFIRYPLTVVYLSGIAEFLLGLGLLTESLRSASARGLIILLVLIFPANIYMAVSQKFRKIPRWLLYLRLPLQGVLIWWAWQYA